MELAAELIIRVHSRLAVFRSGCLIFQELIPLLGCGLFLFWNCGFKLDSINRIKAIFSHNFCLPACAISRTTFQPMEFRWAREVGGYS
jgi:hypothetical protein